MAKKVSKVAAARAGLPFGVGDAVLIRTVTMILAGRVVSIGTAPVPHVVLEEAGWIADTERFHLTLTTGAVREFEPAPSWVVVWLGAGVDTYPWPDGVPLPREAK
jgi:hypothetical protein